MAALDAAHREQGQRAGSPAADLKASRFPAALGAEGLVGDEERHRRLRLGAIEEELDAPTLDLAESAPDQARAREARRHWPEGDTLGKEADRDQRIVGHDFGGHRSEEHTSELH